MDRAQLFKKVFDSSFYEIKKNYNFDVTYESVLPYITRVNFDFYLFDVNIGSAQYSIRSEGEDSQVRCLKFLPLINFKELRNSYLKKHNKRKLYLGSYADYLVIKNLLEKNKDYSNFMFVHLKNIEPERIYQLGNYGADINKETVGSFFEKVSIFLKNKGYF